MDIVCVVKKYARKYKVFLIALICSVVFFLSYFGNTTIGDTSFHLARIKEMSIAIRNFEFLPTMQYNNANGYGYMVDLFYPNLFLYIPAVLNAIGVNLDHSVRIFLFIITFMTFVITYYSGKKIIGNDDENLLLTLIYTMSFRFFCVYLGSFSSLIASTFMPLLIYGLYEFIYDNKYKKLTIGMCLILYSHLPTAFLSCVFCIICLILNWKKIKFIHIINGIKVIFFTTFLCSGFLFPFFKMALSGNFIYGKFHSVSFYLSFGIDSYTSFLVTCFVSLILYILYKKLIKKYDKKICDSVVICLFSIFMLTDFFIWDVVVQLPCFNAIQFPYRILYITVPFICYLAVKAMLRWKVIFEIMCLAIACVCIFSGSSYFFDNTFSYLALFGVEKDNHNDFFDEDTPNLPYYSLIGAEYLNIETLEYFDYDLSPFEKEYGLQKFNEDNSNINVKLVDRHYEVLLGEDFKELNLPINYYISYKAHDENGNEVNIEKNENGFIQLHDVKKGKIVVKHETLNIQYIGLFISLCTLPIFIYCDNKSMNSVNLLKEL